MSTSRRFLIVFTVGVLATGMVAGALVKRSSRSNREGQPEVTKSGPATPADLRIQKAQALIKQSNQKADGYNLLASAYMQKARETADHRFNANAQNALARSFEIEPDNYDALKLQAKLLLSNHRFAEALEVSRRAQLQRLDDADVYGAITDANVELGNYAEAIQSAQEMVDLRPDTSAYSRIAYLRSLHGDERGAVNAMKVAVRASDPGDPEGMAWCRVQLGNELINLGKRAEAEQEYANALKIFAGHHAAIEAQARARVAAGDFNGAIALYNQLQAKATSADPALALGDLYAVLGRPDEAERQYQLFERLERENVETEKSWRHLVFYWLDHDKNLGESLTRAREEREKRKDIFTCDLLAWALYKSGRVAEARVVIEEALRLGTRDARISYHAGLIYSALGLKESGVKYLKRALDIKVLDVIQAEAAKQALKKLEMQ